MAYSKQTWANDLAGGTPLSAARLNVMESGIETADKHVRSGTGSPESAVTAPVGDLYTDTATGKLYLKASGTGNTGWTEKGAAGAAGSIAGMVQATVANYPTIDPTGVADSSGALSTALADARGGTLLIPPGTYLVNSRITVTLTDGQDLHVIADGAKFVCGSTSTSQGRMLRFTNTVGTVRNVTTVSETITAANEYGFQNIPIATLTCSTTPTGIAINDFVRVVADDLVPGPAAGSVVRSGQTCQVVNVSGNDVVVRGHLRDAFTTNVRLARLASPRLTWEGGRFTDSAANIAASTTRGELIETRLMIRPSFAGMIFEELMGAAFNTRHSLGWLIDDVHFRFLHNQSSAVYGYGIVDCGELGIASRLHANGVRHAYTTVAEDTTSTNASIEQYGRTYGTKVVNSTAHACMAAAWDTHGDAWGVQFINCDSYDSEGAFHLRGRYCIVAGGRVVGPHQGSVVTIDDTSSSDTSYGHDISGLVIMDTTYRIFVVSNASVTSEPSYFHDCNILNRDTTDYIFHATNSVIQHRDIRVAAGGTRAAVSGTASVAIMTAATDTA